MLEITGSSALSGCAVEYVTYISIKLLLKKMGKRLSQAVSKRAYLTDSKHGRWYSISLVMRKLKLKPQQDTATHPLEWLKLKRLTTVSVDKDV